MTVKLFFLISQKDTIRYGKCFSQLFYFLLSDLKNSLNTTVFVLLPFYIWFQNSSPELFPKLHLQLPVRYLIFMLHILVNSNYILQSSRVRKFGCLPLSLHPMNSVNSISKCLPITPSSLFAPVTSSGPYCVSPRL